MARLVARLKACPDEELEFSHRLLQPLWSVMLWHASKSATPLQCAVTKNAVVNPLECAVANSLDLKSPGMNSYKKGWGYPLVARIGGRTFRSDNRSWPSEGLLSPEASGAEAHNLGIGSMSEPKLRPPDFNCLLFLAATPAGKMPALLTSDSRH